MTTTSATTYPITIGTKPVGPTDSTTRHLLWATITEEAEDTTRLTVTAYEGWGITDEVYLHGRKAHALAERIARGLIVRA